MFSSVAAEQRRRECLVRKKNFFVDKKKKKSNQKRTIPFHLQVSIYISCTVYRVFDYQLRLFYCKAMPKPLIICITMTDTKALNQHMSANQCGCYVSSSTSTYYIYIFIYICPVFFYAISTSSSFIKNFILAFWALAERCRTHLEQKIKSMRDKIYTQQPHIHMRTRARDEEHFSLL